MNFLSIPLADRHAAGKEKRKKKKQNSWAASAVSLPFGYPLWSLNVAAPFSDLDLYLRDGVKTHC